METIYGCLVVYAWRLHGKTGDEKERPKMMNATLRLIVVHHLWLLFILISSLWPKYKHQQPQ